MVLSSCRHAAIVLLIGSICTGCQTGHELSSSTVAEVGPSQSDVNSAVAEELGPVAVLRRERAYFPKSNQQAKQEILQAGFSMRGSVDELMLRHLSGTTANVYYFTELKESGIGAGALQVRNFGHSKALVKINDQFSGECTILEPVVGLSDISYARPIALDDGEQVPIGSVKVEQRKFEVISRCRHIGEQGAVSVFFNGRNRTVWNDYEIDGRVVAKRTCPPEEAVEFSPDLSVEEQLCIAADMRFRLKEDRVVQRQANTIFVPVYY